MQLMRGNHHANNASRRDLLLNPHTPNMNPGNKFTKETLSYCHQIVIALPVNCEFSSGNAVQRAENNKIITIRKP
jgi:hypothetical protein